MCIWRRGVDRAQRKYFFIEHAYYRCDMSSVVIWEPYESRLYQG